MNYKDMISGLSDKEKIDLAAKLTQAAITLVSLNKPSTMQLGVAGACDATLIAFGEILRFIDSGEEPPRNSRCFRWEIQ